MAPLLVYADDLILMSEHASGLQRQLDALASFCEQRQLTVNLSKTKVVFETCQSDVCDFVLSGAVGEQVESHRTGRHDLRVDPARWADGGHLDRTDRLCLDWDPEANANEGFFPDKLRFFHSSRTARGLHHRDKSTTPADITEVRSRPLYGGF
ncbi:TPA: hypothetical protein ACH3X3_008289 [Trebouxia sp. C0006]